MVRKTDLKSRSISF